MKHLLAASLLLLIVAAARAGGPKTEPKIDPEAPKGPPGWKVEVLYEQPKVNYCSVVACAPDGRIFLAEDPMDMVGPPNKPIDRILCIHPDGKFTVFAEGLYAIFGLVYMDGKLYVHHSPKFSVFEDGGDVGKNRVDLIDCTHPQPWGGMNDHIPANFRLGMDGWFYLSAGDKGIYGAVGKDGSKAEILGGGILRFKPDGTKLEAFTTGTRNHLDMALNSEDEMFTYDNTDDGLGWWTKVTHMVDGGFYGYPYDYKPRRPYTLWMMNDYGGGSPTGALAYNEDALPKEYHGNLFMCEWGKGELARFVVERDGATYKIVRRDAFLKKGSKEFRPVGVAVSPDGMSIYLADWNYGGWSNKTAKAGRLIKATYLGKSEAAPKPAWYVPAAMGKPFQATTAELVQGLSHPAQSVRLVAMRRVAERGKEAVPLLEAIVKDPKAAPAGRWSAIWTLDRLGAGQKTVIAALGDADPSVRRQAARQLGAAKVAAAVKPLADALFDDDRSVRFQAATALGRIGDPEAIDELHSTLGETDLFVRYAAFTALNRIGRANPKAWRSIARGMMSERPGVSEGTRFAFRETYEPEAVEALAAATRDPRMLERGEALALLGSLALQRPAWKGQWWGTQPANNRPPARTVDWAGTKTAIAALVDGLKDGDSLVRQGAAQGLVASNHAALAIQLAVHIAEEKDVAARRSMVRSLATVKSNDPVYVKEANRLVADLFGSVTDPDLIGDTIALAAALPKTTPQVVDGLLKQLGGKLPAGMQVSVLDALSKSDSDKALAAIASKARGDEPGVVNHSIKLLTTMKGDEATGALVDALKNKSPGVRKDAAIALGKRKDKAAIPALLEAMNDKDVRFDALTALAQTPDKRALELYVDGTASKNQQQREACLNAVKALKDEALPAIEARLGKEPKLPAESILALQNFYSKDPEKRKSPLFTVAAKTITVGDFLTAAVKQNGDVERGRKMFMDLKGAACIKCHKVGKDNAGGDVGPDLRGIGAKYNRQQLAESVLDPSKQILDGYDMTIIETKAGQVIQGIVKAEADGDVTLLDAEGKKLVVKAADIDSRAKAKKSIMPDGLHVGMTTSEFADLVSYLESLKEKAEPPATKTSSSSSMIRPRGDHPPRLDHFPAARNRATGGLSASKRYSDSSLGPSISSRWA